MANIKSYNSSAVLNIDVQSTAARITPYSFDGTPYSVNRQTYSVATPLITAAGTPTSLFVITGSVTSTVRVLRMTFSGVSTSGVNVPIYVQRKISPNVGGTTTPFFGIPMDNNAASTAASALVYAYTANFTTAGTIMGSLYSCVSYLPPATTVTSLANNVTQIDFTEIFGEPIVLPGKNDILELYSGIVQAGAAYIFSVTWTET